MGSVATHSGDFPFDNLVDALRNVAEHTSEGIISYHQHEGTREPSSAQETSYAQLLHTAQDNARILRESLFRHMKPNCVVLVHFSHALDSITWFWSVLLAGATPVVTGPGMFSQDPMDRQKHLKHLDVTLNSPICITRRSLLGPFEESNGTNGITATTIEEILDRNTKNRSESDKTPVSAHTWPAPSGSDEAAIMLTSGSSGNAKAVPLTHRQILAAFRGKAAVANLQYPDSPFLSWVHMDHVANLVHVHLFAIASGVSQIQVPSGDILVDPVQLLNLVSRHRVSRTFAPNFLFAKLRRQLESGKTSNLDKNLDLKTLYLDTGGEANVVEVCNALQKLLGRYGAPEDVFKPSFGMTETCAGCIFNSCCPSYDHGKRLDFASLGKPMPGFRMRVTHINAEDEETNSGSGSVEASVGERGSLEVKGDALFEGYYNNTEATKEAFTSDGWFRTGDLAFIDEAGNLHLDGRTKEMININGMKYLPYELDAALEQADLSGAAPSFFCNFSTRTASMDTEAVVVLYLPTYDDGDDKARYETQSDIIRVISMHTNSRPQVVPLRLEDMPKSTLGKLSRTKLKAAFEAGTFNHHQTVNDIAIKRYRQKTRGDPETPEEEAILEIIRDQLEIPVLDDFSVNDSLFTTSATSMDLVAIVKRVNNQLRLPRPIRLTDVLTHSTTRELAKRVGKANGTEKHEYDPVVVLQPHGNKAPLWLVHPGVGEVLVFVNMAHHVTDRPVYGFRAKGFNAAEGETPFTNLEEVFETYKSAIKKRQPKGPYAIAGYSFGGMVAFEITKRLESEGDEVAYCGSWNLPPHIKWRMRELLWDECVIHLFYFVGLMDEAEAYTHKPALCEFERQGRRLDAIRYLRQHCDGARWDELGLSEEYYLLWVGLASNMQGMATDYEPGGSVKCMDVFVADPLSHVAKNREDWIENRLSAWKEFVRDGVRFHHVKGAHYTMLSPEFVPSFVQTLRKVLRERGL